MIGLDLMISLSGDQFFDIENLNTTQFAVPFINIWIWPRIPT